MNLSMTKRISFGAMLAIFPIVAAAQGNPAPDLADRYPDTFTRWEMYGALIVLLYSAIMVSSSFVLIKYGNVSEDAVVRLMALVMLVTATLLLVVLHFRPEQIAAALGLLGTLAGYVLGRSDAKKKE